MLLWLPESSKLVGVLGVVFAALGVAVPVWLSWQQERSAARPEDLAGQLARAVQRQCDLDAEANQLNELEPLMLRWTRAPADLSDQSVEAGGLDGQWSDVVEQYRRIPSGRWVILGSAGSGKSTLQLHLVRSLLTVEQDLVPVQFPLASWDPRQRLHEWMAGHLSEAFPTLRLPDSVTDAERLDALEEVVRSRVLPVLDGLDEMAAEHQPVAIRALNKLDRRFGYVLTCRTEEFRTAVESGRRRLVGAALVELQPLSLTEAAAYLRQVPGSDQDGWTERLGRLSPSDPLAIALNTPLMVWLAGASYADQPDELTGWSDPDTLKGHLLDKLIPTVYEEDRRWRVEDARHWLTYLAEHVHRRRDGAPDGDPDDIAWWRLADAAEPMVRVVAAITATITTGGAFGLGIGYLFGPAAGVVAGIALGVPMGFASARSRLPPTTVEMRLRPKLSVGLAAGLFTGMIAGGAVWVATRDESAIWALAGFGVPLGGVYGLTSAVDVAHATSPAAVLRRERVFVLAYVAAYGLACGVAAWVLGNPAYGLLLGVVAGLAGGLFNGLPWLLVFGLFRRGEMEANVGAVAWFRFLLAKLTWLGPRPRLPWRLMTFLEDARAHGILRQVGAVHQFRHTQLSERLAGVRPAADPVSEQSEGPSLA